MLVYCAGLVVIEQIEDECNALRNILVITQLGCDCVQKVGRN